MDGVLEVLSKPPDDRTEEDIGKGRAMGREGGEREGFRSQGSSHVFLVVSVIVYLRWSKCPIQYGRGRPRDY